VMGCDLPLVNQEAIETLCEQRNEHKYASTFISASDGMPEPLLSIYEPKSLARFFQYLAMNRNCPRKILLNSPVELISQGENNWLDNINTPEDFDRINNILTKAKRWNGETHKMMRSKKLPSQGTAVRAKIYCRSDEDPCDELEGQSPSYSSQT